VNAVFSWFPITFAFSWGRFFAPCLKLMDNASQIPCHLPIDDLMTNPKTIVYEFTVSFGDCDPAGIVFYPNYSRWMDASSENFFRGCGLPPWRELEKTTGIIGTPLLEIRNRFVQPASYGQTLQIHTHVAEWRGKAFIQNHRVMRGIDLICEGQETRIFCIKHPEIANKIKAIPLPEDIKLMCS
jgi:4-hydroxybenzoyl-CoA thioesterase